MLLEITVGAVLAVLSYSSLAIVLLIAALAATGFVPLDVALGLTLGANLGSGLLGVLTTAGSPSRCARCVGNLMFKRVGVLVGRRSWAVVRMRPFLATGHDGGAVPPGFNILIALCSSPSPTRWRAGGPLAAQAAAAQQPARHLDPSACPRRRWPSPAPPAKPAPGRCGGSMLQGNCHVVKTDDMRLSQDLRKVDDTTS